MSVGLGTGLRALLAAQVGLDTVGHNLANANTPGYSRQRVDLTQAMPTSVRGILIGQGVDIGSISRSVDDLLLRRIHSQVSVSGRLNAQFGHMAEVEAFFSEPADSSIGALMEGLFSQVSALGGSPNDGILKGGVVRAGVELAARTRDLGSTLGDIGGTVVQEVKGQINEVNRLADDVARLNIAIGEQLSSGGSASDLLDQRDRALRSLSELVDIRTLDGGGGSVRVTVGGNTIVGKSAAYKMQVTKDNAGELAFQIESATGYVSITGGSIGGLMEFQEGFSPQFAEGLDSIARNLIREFNRAHSTGVPASGGFTSLHASYAFQDADGDGSVTDERLSFSGLPFEMSDGVLHVNVSSSETGEVVKHKIPIDADRTTVQDFLDSFNEIPQLSATVDSIGVLQITSDAGYKFDFSSRLETNPDRLQTFGSGRASLTTGGTGPFALADGDTLDITAGGSSFSINFSSADFDAIAEATPEEIAAAINADPGAQANGFQAVTVNGALFLQSVGSGSGQSFTVDGGSSAGALGLTSFVGSTISGSDNAVEPKIGGSYTGTGSQEFTFVPRSNGTIGTTADLAVDVYNSAGQVVTSLDVGAGYVPGTELTVSEGITVSFGLGELSASHGDRFSVDVTDNSDTADVLVATGLNAFFTGSSASDIDVRADLRQNSELLATSSNGVVGDNGTVARMGGVQDLQVDELNGLSINLFYGQVVGSLGFEVNTVNQALEANESLLGSLDQRAQSLSGVNVDEELVDMLEFEQAFQTAARFLSVVNELGQELLNII